MSVLVFPETIAALQLDAVTCWRVVESRFHCMRFTSKVSSPTTTTMRDLKTHK